MEEVDAIATVAVVRMRQVDERSERGCVFGGDVGMRRQQQPHTHGDKRKGEVKCA